MASAPDLALRLVALAVLISLARPRGRNAGEDGAIPDAPAAYQAAVDLYTQENSLVWDRFNMMVAANSFILGGGSLLTADSTKLGVPALVLPAFGMVLCLTWFFMMRRSFHYHEHWRSSAEKLEWKAFHGSVRTVQDAAKLRRSWLKARGYATLLICLFGVVHFAMMLHAWLSIADHLCDSAAGAEPPSGPYPTTVETLLRLARTYLLLGCATP